MKKMLWIGVICIIIGGIFCGAAYAVGENYVSANMEFCEDIFNSNDVNRIELIQNVANVKFLSGGNSESIKIEAENILIPEYKCSVSDGILQIKYNPRSVKFGFVSFPTGIFNINNKMPEIRIYIPAGKKFDEVNFDGGVGKIETTQLNAKALMLNGGVGEYNIKGLTTDSLTIESGVGSIKIEGIINGGTKIDGGVGEIKISGQINGDIDLTTGVGSVELNLTGNASDYNIKVDKGLGSAKLNGSPVSYVNNDGKYNINVDAGVGSIDINIKVMR